MRSVHVVFALLLISLSASPRSAEADKYDVYAVRFATIANFPVSSLVAGADRSRRMDIAMTIWVLKGANGRVALVDSGFHREQYFRQFAVRDYVKPSEAIAPLGLKPEEITDIFLTHMHWDHAGGIDLFPSARIWIQKDEYMYYTGAAWQPGGKKGGIDADDIAELLRRNTQGKLRLIAGVHGAERLSAIRRCREVIHPRHVGLLKFFAAALSLATRPGMTPAQR